MIAQVVPQAEKCGTSHAADSVLFPLLVLLFILSIHAVCVCVYSVILSTDEPAARQCVCVRDSVCVCALFDNIWIRCLRRRSDARVVSRQMQEQLHAAHDIIALDRAANDDNLDEDGMAAHHIHHLITECHQAYDLSIR